MRWKINGAAANTGEDASMTVEAPTRDEAEQIARYNGLLVSSVTNLAPPPAPVVSYAGPQTIDGRDGSAAAPLQPPGPKAIVAPALPAAGSVPEYRDILGAARWLRAVALLFAVIGCLCLVVAVIECVVTLRGAAAASDEGLSWGAYVAAFVGALPAAEYGLWFITVCLLLRLLASVSRAVRDIARNSASKRS